VKVTELESAAARMGVVDRAAGDLRRGGFVVLEGERGVALTQAAEMVTRDSLAVLRQLADGHTSLALTAPRARALELASAGSGVVALSLVVGGIVIMNIMLMVVSERTREIGLRKALGARRRDIIWQILTESVTLSTLGGVVGILLGFALALVISKVTPLPAAVQVWSVAMGIGITALVGLFFGLYPAMRAAKLDPIEALRRE